MSRCWSIVCKRHRQASRHRLIQGPLCSSQEQREGEALRRHLVSTPFVFAAARRHNIFRPCFLQSPCLRLLTHPTTSYKHIDMHLATEVVPYRAAESCSVYDHRPCKSPHLLSSRKSLCNVCVCAQIAVPPHFPKSRLTLEQNPRSTPMPFPHSLHRSQPPRLRSLLPHCCCLPACPV